MAYFPNAQTGRKHQAEKCFEFRVCNCRKEGLHFLPGGNKRQIGIKLPEWKLVRIPGPAQDISGKKRSWEIQALTVRSESCRSF